MVAVNRPRRNTAPTTSESLRYAPVVFSPGEEKEFEGPQVSAKQVAEGISILACLKDLSLGSKDEPHLTKVETPQKTIRKRSRTNSGKKKNRFDLARPTSHAANLSAKDMQAVDDLLSSAGLSSKTVVNLISNQADKYEVQRETGFSHNYIMALQRKVLRNSEQLQLRPPEKHQIGGHWIHILFEDDNRTPLLIRKELFTCLSMSGTSFSYWRKRASVDEIDTSMDFRLMDQCRSIFGGRATYTLYTAQAAFTILQKMEGSRLKNTFTNFDELKALISMYLQPTTVQVKKTSPMDVPGATNKMVDAYPSSLPSTFSPHSHSIPSVSSSLPSSLSSSLPSSIAPPAVSQAQSHSISSRIAQHRSMLPTKASAFVCYDSARKYPTSAR